MFKDLVSKSLKFFSGAQASGGGNPLAAFATSFITDKFKEKLKRGAENVFGGDAQDLSYQAYIPKGLDYSAFMMGPEGVSRSKVAGFPGPLIAEDPGAISFLCQKRLNTYTSSGEVA